MPVRRTQSTDPKSAKPAKAAGRDHQSRDKKRSGNRPPKQLFGEGKKKSGRAASAARGRTAGPSVGEESVRLQRMLAAAGFGSRRQCEELIEAGRVEVDGETITKLGTTVNPAENKIRVDGNNLKPQKLVYFAVNKPIGFVTTNRDPQGRPRVIDLVPPTERVFPVGRLDLSSEGLILLTNDGELAQRLTHPKYGIRKVYRVTVAGKVDHEAMKKMRNGMYIAEGFVKVEGVKLIKAKARATDLEIVLSEGKNREIRRILARLGHKVMTLQRIAVGSVRLGDVPPGAYRVLARAEVDKLYSMVENAMVVVPPEKKKASKKRTGAKKSTSIKKRPGGKETDVSRRSSTATSKRSAKKASTSTGSSRSAGSSKSAASSKSAGRRIPSDIKIQIPGSESKSSRKRESAGAVIGGDAPPPEVSTPETKSKNSRSAKAKRASKKTTRTSKVSGKRGRSTKRGRS